MNYRAQRRLTIALILLGVILAFFAAFAFTLAQVTVEKVELIGVKDFSKQGMTPTVEFTLQNNGIFSVDVREITYKATLAETSEVLAQGTLPGGRVTTEGFTRLQADVPLTWEPTMQLAAKLLAGGNSTITIEGTAVIGSGPFRQTVPFRTDVAADEYVRQFVPKSQEELFATVLSFLN